MSLITGKTKCKRCKHEVENDDMAGDTCIDCLNDMARQQRRDEDKQLRAEHCERCWNGPLPVELECWPCGEIERQRILMRQEDE